MSNSSPEPHLENLRPFSKDDVERARECGKKGKKRQKEIKEEKIKEEKERAKLKDIALILGGMAFGNEKIKGKFKEYIPNIPKEISVDTAMMIGQQLQAIKGSSKSAIFIRDTRGEKPVDKKALTTPDGENLIGKGSLTIKIGGKDID